MFEECRGIFWHYVCTFVFPELPRARACAVLETVVVNRVVALSRTVSGLWPQLAAGAFYQPQSTWWTKETRRTYLRTTNIWFQSERAGQIWATDAMGALEASESRRVGYGGLSGTLDR